MSDQPAGGEHEHDEVPGPPGEQGPRGRPGPAGGERGPRGPEGNQPKLRWTPAIGYVLLAVFVLWAFNHERDLSERATRLERAQIEQVKHDCVDRAGDIAVRRQWKRVAEIIDHTAPQAKPGSPGYIPPERAGKLFADSYKQALKEAGAVPPCIGAG